ncbi:hypothetical protein FDECE_12641 [Fusarium decemcellulare]|nr:hypothetical protein FDECE_12641 [Fusarium decemcellulare]
MRIQFVREWCRGDESTLRDALDMMDFLPGVSGRSVSIFLLQLILWTRVTFRASDQRDCVYAFQGILNHVFSDEEIPKELQADYDTPTTQLIIRFTTVLLRETQSLYVLSLVCDPTQREISGTPSWVPDLSPSASANPMLWPCLKSMVAGDSLFNASASTRHGFRIQGNKLFVHGQKVSTVRMMGEELDEALQGRFKGWAELMLAMDPTYKPTGQTRGDAFRRVVVLDQDESRRPASSEVLDKVSQIITWIMFSAARRAFYSKTPPVIQFLTDLDVVFQAAAEVQDCLLPAREVVEEACIKYGMLPETEKFKILHGEEKQLWLRDFHGQASSGAGLLLIEALGHRRPFMLANAYIGCGPKSTVKGDEIWILSGCRTPLVLRKLGVEKEYHLIGETYIHGIMHGEFVDHAASWESLFLV